MIVKVCGLTQPVNYKKLCDLDIDMIGINFYKPSSRYIGNQLLDIKKGQKRVGVFVGETIEKIEEAIERHHLDYAQLHGDEIPVDCRLIQRKIPIIKVFRIDENFCWPIIEDFIFSDYFLFDTKTSKFGGSGNKFDWSVLDNYKMDVPFFLSGGISLVDAKGIKNIEHDKLVGVDINSRFESGPGIKDISLVRKFIEELKN